MGRKGDGLKEETRKGVFLLDIVLSKSGLFNFGFIDIFFFF